MTREEFQAFYRADVNKVRGSDKVKMMSQGLRQCHEGSFYKTFLIGHSGVGKSTELTRLSFEVAFAQGDYSKAGKLYAEAKQVFKQKSARLNEAECLLGLGMVSKANRDRDVALGQIAKAKQEEAVAIEFFNQALSIYKEFDSKRWIGEAYILLSKVAPSIEEAETFRGLAKTAWQTAGLTNHLVRFDGINPFA